VFWQLASHERLRRSRSFGNFVRGEWRILGEND